MDDLISRQAAIDALGEAPEVWTNSPEEFAALNQWEMDLVAIKAVPSADRPSGHWVLINRGLDIYMCDRCGEILQIDSVPIWDYCPVCGARMEGETDGRPNQQTGGIGHPR